jgi:hypothetical protein
MSPTTAVGPSAGAPDPSAGAAGPGVETGTETEITQDELFDVLSNRRRRYAVHLLEREDGPLQLGPLAEQIAAWENGIDIGAVSCAQRKRVYTALQQIHLPQMDEAGIVAYDDRAGVVEPTEAMVAMDVYVDLVEGRDVPWSGYYLGFSTVGVAVLAGAWAGVRPLEALPSVALAIFVLVTVAVFAVGHHYYTTRQRLGRTERPPELRYGSGSPVESDD